MQINIGWGKHEITFFPKDTKYQSHIDIKHIECGGYGGEPTGLTSVWWIEPTSIPQIIVKLEKCYKEWEDWKEQYNKDNSIG